MSIDEQPMNVYWSGKRTETSNNFKTNYKGSIATKNNLPNSGNKMGDMYNVTESGENFIWNGSSWDSLSGDTLKTLNWQKSEKASTVAIYPVPETTLHPVVEFAFTETDPAEGEKSLTNPSTITGVSSITVTRCETVGVSSADYTIDLNGTYYGGSVDLSTGIMTVTSVLETITSSRPFLPTSLVEKSNSYLLAYFPSVARQKQNLTSNIDIVCNSMPCVYGAIQDERCVQFNGGGAGIGLNLLKTDLDLGDEETADVVKEAFLSWLKGKNIEVVYPVFNPFTIQLTPTQILSLVQTDKYTPKLNTIYTDASSVQVGYAKSPVRSEYELTQAIAAIE